jgi:hypothetical protein
MEGRRVAPTVGQVPREVKRKSGDQILLKGGEKLYFPEKRKRKTEREREI